MNIEFEKHIVELLKNNACVVLPGFGGFIAKPVASSIHQSVIFPPSKNLAFNAYLSHDDDLLTGAVMLNYGFSYPDAKSKVLSYAAQLSYTLKKDQQVSMPYIGSFTVSENNQIIFKPFVSAIMDKESFGFQSLVIRELPKKVVVENANAQLKQIEYLKEERKTTTRKIAKLPTFGFVSSLLLIAGVVSLMVSKTPFPSKAAHQAGFVEHLFPKDSFVESFNNTPSTFHFSDFYTSLQKEGYNNEQVHAFTIKEMASGYYIVLGSYASLENAQRKEQEIFALGKDSYILPAENGFHRVCIFADSNFLQAKEKLALEATNYPGSWLMKNI